MDFHLPNNPLSFPGSIYFPIFQMVLFFCLLSTAGIGKGWNYHSKEIPHYQHQTPKQPLRGFKGSLGDPAAPWGQQWSHSRSAEPPGDGTQSERSCSCPLTRIPAPTLNDHPVNGSFILPALPSPCTAPAPPALLVALQEPPLPPQVIMWNTIVALGSACSLFAIRFYYKSTY